MKLLFQNESGLSVVEVILATALFMIFATGAISVVIQGLDSNRLGSEETVANQFAAEGLEAAKSIKNQAYTNVTTVNPTPRAVITQAPGTWTFGANNTNNTIAHSSQAGDNYTRTIKVENVNRDASGNIVAAPAGTLDPDVKKVTSTVSWKVSASRNNSVVLSTYMTDWRKPIVSGGPIMMAYSKTTTTPFYRIWNGSAWSAEASAQVVGGNINYIVLKSSRTRNEAALGTLDSNGNINVQIWNGTAWGTPTLMVNVATANSTTRSFDIAYEKSGDRLVVAYLLNSTSADFAYRIWNGTSWTSATTVTTPPTTGVIKSIDMTQNPVSTSNEIAMIMMDANIDVYGMVWTGSAWSNMATAAVWDATASIATKKAVDVAYEQTSGRAVFIWGDSVATDQYYRIWNGTTLTAPTLLDIPAAGGIVHWMELVSRPNSNELLYATVDAGADLNTRKWNGTSAWDTATQHAEHSAGVENITSMVFDITWETHTANPGKAWLLWGNGTAVSAKPWSGSAWGAAVTIPSSDDTSFIRLKADPTSGAVFAGIYESAASATDDIYETRLTGGGAAWSAKNSIWAGPITAEPVHFRIDIATP